MPFTEREWFSEEEFAPHGEKMDAELLSMLDLARAAAGVPFKITSGWREDSKAHFNGRGVDIACTESGPRFRILFGLIQAGFNRIGVYDLHIHADCERAPSHPESVIWLGESQ